MGQEGVWAHAVCGTQSVSRSLASGAQGPGTLGLPGGPRIPMGPQGPQGPWGPWGPMHRYAGNTHVPCSGIASRLDILQEWDMLHWYIV